MAGRRRVFLRWTSKGMMRKADAHFELPVLFFPAAPVEFAASSTELCSSIVLVQLSSSTQQPRVVAGGGAGFQRCT